jgi:predicted PurR-regulated permease PerM
VRAGGTIAARGIPEGVIGADEATLSSGWRRDAALGTAAKLMRPLASRLQFYAQFAALLVVAIGCIRVLQPFVPAMLFAAVACSASWPLHTRLRKATGDRTALAALMMTLVLALLVLGPSALLSVSLAEHATRWGEAIRAALERGPIMPPAWLKSIPLVGGLLDGYWHRLAESRDELAAFLKALMEPARAVLIGAAKAVSQTVLQLVLAALVSFFFYRDGEAIVRTIRSMLRRLAGPVGDELLDAVAHTVSGVVSGLFGTALAQALVAVIGFLIAGVPGALLLGGATFLLSVVPVGPPLVWGGAAIWLHQQGRPGWAFFMVLWGVLAISSIDNIIKPYLISRTSSLPLLMIVFGVLGGVIAFGFMGVFIGPALLAIGLTLGHYWLSRSA